jgi:hypothetical protein
MKLFRFKHSPCKGRIRLRIATQYGCLHFATNLAFLMMLKVYRCGGESSNTISSTCELVDCFNSSTELREVNSSTPSCRQSTHQQGYDLCYLVDNQQLVDRASLTLPEAFLKFSSRPVVFRPVFNLLLRVEELTVNQSTSLQVCLGHKDHNSMHTERITKIKYRHEFTNLCTCKIFIVLIKILFAISLKTLAFGLQLMLNICNIIYNALSVHGCSFSVYYDLNGLDRKLNYQFKIPYFKNKTVGILSKDIFVAPIPRI